MNTFDLKPQNDEDERSDREDLGALIREGLDIDRTEYDDLPRMDEAFWIDKGEGYADDYRLPFRDYNAIDQGYYDDDPNPYHGDYSEE